MTRPAFEVADVIRAHGNTYLEARGARVTSAHRKILSHLAQCRTAALGGHAVACADCGTVEHSYNSCRDRHCPKCNFTRSAQWLAARERDLLDVPYFHVVFTLPEELNGVELGNKSAFFDILFRAVSETLLEVAAGETHLAARIGFFAILHTWGQTLTLHPHVHCVIPAAGFRVSDDTAAKLNSAFLLPVKVLSAVFRGKMLDFLGRAARRGMLRVTDQPAFLSLLAALKPKSFVVYAKQTFGTPHHVLRYLARYTHRVAITNHRLVSLDKDSVTFRYRDRADANNTKVMSLHAHEFLRRFLLHTLPTGFQRIRHYGFLANRVRKERLNRWRHTFQSPPPATDAATTPAEPNDSPPPRACRACGSTHLLVYELPPDLALNSFFDTS